MDEMKAIESKIMKLEKDMNDAQDNIIALIDRVGKLEWVLKNPPKYKYGDIVRFRDINIKLTIKNDGEVKDSCGVLYRDYLIDDGSGLRRVDECYLNKK